MAIKGCSLLLGAIFLMAIFSSYVSAFQWTEYGNSFIPLWQSSTGGFSGKFPSNVYNTTINQGYTLGTPVTNLSYQPLISDFNSNSYFGIEKQYVIFSNNNFLDVYNSNLLLQGEISTPTSISQIGITNSGTDIAGVFQYNATNYAYEQWLFNPSVPSLSLSYQQNFSVNSGTQVAGVRCRSYECYFILDNAGTNATFVAINKTTMTQNTLQNDTYLKPVAFSDIDNDGVEEFLAFSSSRFTTFTKSGGVELNVAIGGLQDAKMFSPDGSSLWKIATISQTGTQNVNLSVYRIDGSVYWGSIITTTNPTSIGSDEQKMAIHDFDGDGLPDIYVAYHLFYGGNNVNYYKAFKGLDGTQLYSFSYITGSSTQYGLTLADMNGNNVFDFIGKTGNYLEVIDATNVSGNARLYQTADTSVSACVPADLDMNGYLDIICSGNAHTQVYFSNYTNQIPQIISVAYNPSVNLTLGQTLTTTTTANDTEGNQILYSNKCSNTDSWSGTSISNVATCNYAGVGTYNMSVGVTDSYHTNTNIFSQSIQVFPTSTCGNSICELGETSVNCLVDCPITQTQNFTSTTEGGMAIPTKIVDVNNVDAGLLPEIYYGILAFFSNSLLPLIAIVFTIFFALIIITIARIVHKVAEKT